MKNPYLVFILCFLALLAFFYFYPADIFQAEIHDNDIVFNKEITLKQILNPSLLEGAASPDGFSKVSLTFRGWFILITVILVLPIMVAYRVTLKRYPRRSKPEE